MSDEPDKLLSMIEINKKITDEQIAERDAKIKELTEKNMNLAIMLANLMELARPLPQTEEYLGVQD